MKKQKKNYIWTIWSNGRAKRFSFHFYFVLAANCGTFRPSVTILSQNGSIHWGYGIVQVDDFNRVKNGSFIIEPNDCKWVDSFVVMYSTMEIMRFTPFRFLLQTWLQICSISNINFRKPGTPLTFCNISLVKIRWLSAEFQFLSAL